MKSPPGVGVIEKLIFGEDTHSGREVAVYPRARLKGEAAKLPCPPGCDLRH